MWYKQAGHPYFDIGHAPSKEKPIYLWWWDNGLYVQETTDPLWGHGEIVSRSLYTRDLCRGRYDPSTNTVSVMALGGIPPGCAEAVKSKWPSAKIMLFRK